MDVEVEDWSEYEVSPMIQRKFGIGSVGIGFLRWESWLSQIRAHQKKRTKLRWNACLEVGCSSPPRGRMLIPFSRSEAYFPSSRSDAYSPTVGLNVYIAWQISLGRIALNPTIIVHASDLLGTCILALVWVMISMANALAFILLESLAIKHVSGCLSTL